MESGFFYVVLQLTIKVEKNGDEKMPNFDFIYLLKYWRQYTANFCAYLQAQVPRPLYSTCAQERNKYSIVLYSKKNCRTVTTLFYKCIKLRKLFINLQGMELM